MNRFGRRVFHFISSIIQLLLWKESVVAGIQCPDIELILFADIQTSTPSPHRVGTIAKFTCDAGYKGVGKSQITCLPNGRWSGPTPYCTTYTCQRNLHKIEKGRKCRKRCKRDSQCRGIFKRCECDDWCGKSCFNPNAECDKLHPPKNGYLIERGNSYGHTVTYGCNEGFTLSGPATRRCRSDRKWSGSPPLCISFNACGQPGELKDNRFGGNVLRGKDAKQGAWPWQVLLLNNLEYSVDQIYNVNAGFGGGSIINDQWILSAAHVFTDFSSAFKRNNWKNTFFIVAGMTSYPRRGLVIPEHIQIYEPELVHKHGSFNEDNFDYDVALIRIGKKLKRSENNTGKFITDDDAVAGKMRFSRYVRPVCLPCMKDGPLQPVDILQNYLEQTCAPQQGRHILTKIAPTGSHVMVTGFGLTTSHSNTEAYALPGRLQEGQLKMIDDLKCAENVKDMRRHAPQARFTNRMICASGANTSAKVDACKGDSGGPLVVTAKLSPQTNYWIQIGITSWGWGCGNSYPGFYTSVPSIMKWVRKILNDTKEVKICPPPTAPRNGKVDSRSNTFGSLATYTCNQGYKINGSSNVRCQDDETWGELPICEVDIQCSFENPSRPLCGYKNAGRSIWKRLFLSQNRKGVPTFAIKYDGDATSAILRSPVVPDKKSHCVQFYFKPEDTLQSVNDLTIEVNGVKTRGAAPDGVMLPTNRWIGVQSTIQTEKSSFQFDIIVNGRNIIYVDDIRVIKGKCESPCKVSNLCQNGGTCVDEIQISYCSCGDRHTGQYCEREITCEIPEIENGRVAADIPLVLDSKVHFDCHSGYELRGVSVATCKPKGLSKKPPTCVGNNKDACPRNLAAAAKEGRAKCRKPCKKNKDCRAKNCKRGKPCDVKKCVCDYTCGMSCVNISKTCPPLPQFSHLNEIRYVRQDRFSREFEAAKPPFYYDVRAHHICEPGYGALPNEIRYCHGRTDKTWTREVVCAKICTPKKEKLVKDYNLTCGSECLLDGDCAAGRICTCDGPCGRTCVNLAVTCLDPTKSIKSTGGKLATKNKPLSDGSFAYNTTVHFSCRSGQRLLGSSSRTCMANGRWSGLLAVCDNMGTIERCPHPGVPVGGELVGSTGDNDFVENKWVKFECNEGLVMTGEEEQQCLYIKQWSGDGAPICVDPRYSDSQSEIIGKLQNNVANIRQVRFSKAGGTIRMNSKGKVEVYFVIDLSLSVKQYALRNTIDFAIGLVRRLSLNDTTDRVSYGIVVFATKAIVQLNILELPKKTPKEVIQELNNIVSNIDTIRRNKIMYGTDIEKALRLLNERMLSFSFVNDPQFLIKRHILVLTDGFHNAGGSLSGARRDIELGYVKNPPEFYSITSSATEEELRLIASKPNNYVYVDDFYKLHTYIDQVTDVREDFDTCGQAGDVGSLRRMVSLGRVLGGTYAEERAWPWQALVTFAHDRVLGAFDGVVGGGSLINNKWVLTAAHLFDENVGAHGWEQSYYVALGIVRRPHRGTVLDGSVKIFIPEKIIVHKEYLIHNGTFKKGSYQNDIALIKLGGELVVSSDGRRLQEPVSPGGKVEFTPYIRPVCLPCSVDSCVSKILQKPDSEGKVLINGGEDAKEKCEIEANFLSGKNKKGSTAVVVTGFGHNATLSSHDNYVTPSYKLQQAVLDIEKRSKCESEAGRITRQIGHLNFKHIFTDEMICAIGNSKRAGKLVDACRGDGGGPLSREVRDETTKKSCFVQLGIVSWGYGCGQEYIDLSIGKRGQYPGYYTNVAALMPWITTTMATNDN